MISTITTANVSGIDAHKITVEVDMVNSIPAIVIVGLPDAAISEAKERVRSAIKNSGFMIPPKKIIVNLAPADLKKEGTNFDLPIAVGIVSQFTFLDFREMEKYAFIGEVSLDGTLRPVTGILPIVSGIKDFGFSKIIVPFENAKEAALIPDLEVYAAKNLAQVINHFAFDKDAEIADLERCQNDSTTLVLSENDSFEYDFKDVKGQFKAKKAMELAAAGAHNLLMVGSPGSGKTLLAKCFCSILPPLSFDEAIELTKIYSVSGMLSPSSPLISQRPFRIVHHSASSVGITGGGTNPKPGEITLAHRGVLFLDEMVEFPRAVLEVLRQPLEDNEIVISRSQMRVKYPANFILIGAMNPCPCGYYGDTKIPCKCSETMISRYRSRLSGPLLDRIDIQIEVPRLSPEELVNMNTDAESSSKIRERVIVAREIQTKRFKGTNLKTNADLNSKNIKKHCKLDPEGEALLKNAAAGFNISGRGFDRILKLARTIADLNEKDNIQTEHIAQSLQYRNIM